MKLRTLSALSMGLLISQLSLNATAATTANTAPAAKPAAPTAATATANPTNQTATTATNAATPPVNLDEANYAIGVDIGETFKAQGITINADQIAQGIKDAITGAKYKYSRQDMANTLQAFQKQITAQQQAAFAAQSNKNAADGAAFLAANKTKPGVVTTASGLEYKVIAAGQGPHPGDNDIVTVDYTGTFINGKVFDSSYTRGKPVTFPVSQVIPGWTEVIKLMQPGAIYEVYIPSNLAYGDKGLNNVIGPKQTLVFKIHLISTKSAN